MKEKKNGSRHAGVGTLLHPNFLLRKSAASDHWAMRPLHRLLVKINSVVVFFSTIHTV